MTREERLRAIALLEAVWADDAVALRALSRSASSEQVAARLLAEFGGDVIRGLVLARLSLTGLPGDEIAVALRTSPDGWTSALLGTTLAAWADTADTTAAVEGIGRAVITYMVRSVTGGTEADVPMLLAALRNGATT